MTVVSMPSLAKAEAAYAPAGPPPMTRTVVRDGYSGFIIQRPSTMQVAKRTNCVFDILDLMASGQKRYASRTCGSHPPALLKYKTQPNPWIYNFGPSEIKAQLLDLSELNPSRQAQTLDIWIPLNRSEQNMIGTRNLLRGLRAEL